MIAIKCPICKASIISPRITKPHKTLKRIYYIWNCTNCGTEVKFPTKEGDDDDSYLHRAYQFGNITLIRNLSVYKGQHQGKKKQKKTS